MDFETMNLAYKELKKDMKDYKYMIIKQMERTSTLDGDYDGPFFAKTFEDGYDFVIKKYGFDINSVEEPSWANEPNKYYINSLEEAKETGKILRTPDEGIVYEFFIDNTSLKEYINKNELFESNEYNYKFKEFGTFNITTISYEKQNNIIEYFGGRNYRSKATLVVLDNDYHLVVNEKKKGKFYSLKDYLKKIVEGEYSSKKLEDFNINLDMATQVVKKCLSIKEMQDKNYDIKNNQKYYCNRDGIDHLIISY